MTSSSSFVCIVLGCFFMLLCVSSVHGGCLTDSNTDQPSSAYAKQIWEYTSSAPASPSTSSQLKFTTFNMQSGFHFDCTNDVTADATFLKGNDYFGGQETVQGVDTRCSKCTMAKIIADVTGMSTRFSMAFPWRTGQYGLTVGTTQTILETQYIQMVTAGFETRAPVAIKTKPQALQGRSLWYVDVHIEYYSVPVRQNQIAQILTWVNNIVASDPTAVIMMGGDFNGGPWDPVYATMKAASFQNTWEVFHGSIQDGNTIPADWPGSRFDHIWFRAPSGVSVSVVAAEVPNVLLSDHRPYTATLAFYVSGAVTSAPATPPPASATSKPATQAPATQAPSQGSTTVVWRGTSWAYSSTAPASSWNQLSFDDTRWTNARAPFVNNYGSFTGYGGGGSFFGASNYYFRQKFYVSASASSMTVSVASDNQVDVFLNGVLVGQDTTSWHPAAYWNKQITFTPSMLVSGNNVISIIAYNTDQWAFFDAEVTMVQGQASAPVTSKPVTSSPVTSKPVAATSAPVTSAPVGGTKCRMSWSQALSSSWTQGADTFNMYTVTLKADAPLANFNFKMSGTITSIWDAPDAGNGMYTLSSWIFSAGTAPANQAITFGYVIKSTQPSTITVVGDPCRN